MNIKQKDMADSSHMPESVKSAVSDFSYFTPFLCND